MIGRLFKAVAVAGVISTCVWVQGAIAQASAFESGWTLQPSNSVLSFQSIRNETDAEVSSFKDYAGAIDEGGAAKITIQLDSVDTKIDLRNVRMRFLLFETFNNPEATISLTVPPEMLEDLTQVRRKRVELPYRMFLAGVTKELSAEMIITLIDINTVSVASAYPISIATELFGLSEGVLKLEETAGVDIIPSATVSFNFVFGRNQPVQEQNLLGLVATPRQVEEPVQLTDAECLNRFISVSESNQIQFDSSSATISSNSLGILQLLAAFIADCPDMKIEVAGHTDSSGPAAYNLDLSQLRAVAVTATLARLGVAPSRLTARGYGEDRPIADNTTERGRARNRRIEFIAQSSS